VRITGCRGCDLPCGPPWASTSAAQRGLQRWQAEGTLAAMPARLLGMARGGSGGMPLANRDPHDLTRSLTWPCT
jgi:hypothetical protein